MNDIKKEKLKRFANDELMNETIKEVLFLAFTKSKSNEDVHIKAARFISIGLLEEAWKDIENEKNKIEGEKTTPKQVAL